MCDNCIEQSTKLYNGGSIHVETQTHTGHTIALEFVVREPICDTCLFKIIKELVHNVSQEPQTL